MSFQTQFEAILKPCWCHIILVGTNMALIWLRYGFDMAFKGVIWKYYLSYLGICLPIWGRFFRLFYRWSGNILWDNWEKDWQSTNPFNSRL